MANITTAAQGVDLPVDGHFRGPQVCSLVGITYRQLDYWARTAALVPSFAEARGSGTQRLYTWADVVIARVLRDLSLHGATTDVMRRVTEHLRAVPASALSGRLLVDEEGDVEDMTDDLLLPVACWIVNLDAVLEELSRGPR